jgi:glycerate kinase
MNVLVAFDKFKFSMSAKQACEIVSASQPQLNCTLRPLTDGGEGFCEILTMVCNGEMKTIKVSGPTGKSVLAKIGVVKAHLIPENATNLLQLPTDCNSVAIVEMAQASGIELLDPSERNPWKANTYGTGELLKYASSINVGAILLGLGGSATSDLGLGALQALGLKTNLADQNNSISPEDWQKISFLNGPIQALPPIRIACDVDNPLLGMHGAAAIFGPQKGLLQEDIKKLDELAKNICNQMIHHFSASQKLYDYPGCGAAGGLGFGLKAAYGAEFIPGFSLVQNWLDLEAKIKDSDLVITGEGGFDQSSLNGKGPYALIQLAHKHNKPTLVFAGCLEEGLEDYFLDRNMKVKPIAITPSGTPLEQALEKGPEFLAKAIQGHIRWFC